MWKIILGPHNQIAVIQSVIKLFMKYKHFVEKLVLTFYEDLVTFKFMYEKKKKITVICISFLIRCNCVHLFFTKYLDLYEFKTHRIRTNCLGLFVFNNTNFEFKFSSLQVLEFPLFLLHNIVFFFTRYLRLYGSDPHTT